MEQRVHPADLKDTVGSFINRLTKPIREEFQSPEMQKLILDAYPPAPAKIAISKVKGNHNAGANGTGDAAKNLKSKKKSKEIAENGETTEAQVTAAANAIGQVTVE